MAMNGNTLGTAIGTALYNAIPADVKQCMTADAKAEMCNQLINNWKLIASCVVTHITTNAQVSTNVTVAAAIPVQVTPSTGTGATTATGAGTGTGTIS